MTWSVIVPHGAELTFGWGGHITIRHPKEPTLHIRARRSGGHFVLGAITSRGQLLVLRP